MRRNNRPGALRLTPNQAKRVNVSLIETLAGKEIPALRAGVPPAPQPRIRKTSTEPLEKNIQKAILDALRFSRRVCFVGRFNRGMAVNQDAYGAQRYTAFNSIPGFPDIHGMLRGGKAFYIEVKRPGKKPTIEQENFLAMVRMHGGLAGIATSVEEAFAILYSHD